MQQGAVALPQHGPAPSADHAAWNVDRFGDHLRLNVSKRFFARPLEERTDGAPEALLDQCVRVGETPADALRQVSADSGLSPAGHADERNRLRLHAERQYR